MSDIVKRPDIDARSRRTRNALARALIDLGAEKPVDEITVDELVKRAGVSRSTFYAQFSSKRDYLAKSYADMLARNAEKAEAEAGEPHILRPRRIISHVHAARAYASAAQASEDRSYMLAAGEARLRTIAERNLGFVAPHLPDLDRRMTATFVVGALMSMLRKWIDEGFQESPDVIASSFETLCAIVERGVADRAREDRPHERHR